MKYKQLQEHWFDAYPVANVGEDGVCVPVQVYGREETDEAIEELRRKNRALTSKVAELMKDRSKWRALASLLSSGKKPSSADMLQKAAELDDIEHKIERLEATVKWVEVADHLPEPGKKVEFVADFSNVPPFRTSEIAFVGKLVDAAEPKFIADSASVGNTFPTHRVKKWIYRPEI